MREQAIAVRYKGGAFVPLNPSKVVKIEDGELCFVRIDRQRYWPRHQWFMVLMRECWESLPETLKELYPNPDILRKRILIAAGYANIRSHVFKSEAEARTMSRFIEGALDDYTIVSVQGSVLVLATAQSQAVDSMDADTFKQSVEDVQDHLALMLGCTKDDIRAHISEIRGKKRQKESA